MGVHWPGQPVSFNPIVGCGGDGLPCIERCWAKAVASRGLTAEHRAVAGWDGTVKLVEKALEVPLNRRKPTLYACCLMGDLFHKNVPDEWIDRVFVSMAASPQHTFCLLTKRTSRALDYLTMPTRRNRVEHLHHDQWQGYLAFGQNHLADRMALVFDWPLPNVWLGVSVTNQQDADERIPLLLATPAAHRWVSYEPALGPVDFSKVPGFNKAGSAGVDMLREFCVIAGCESGRGRRPCPDAWLDGVASQCKAAGVPCFVKQRDGGKAGVVAQPAYGSQLGQPSPEAWPWVK